MLIILAYPFLLLTFFCAIADQQTRNVVSLRPAISYGRHGPAYMQHIHVPISLVVFEPVEGMPLDEYIERIGDTLNTMDVMLRAESFQRKGYDIQVRFVRGAWSPFSAAGFTREDFFSNCTYWQKIWGHDSLLVLALESFNITSARGGGRVLGTANFANCLMYDVSRDTCGFTVAHESGHAIFNAQHVDSCNILDNRNYILMRSFSNDSACSSVTVHDLQNGLECASARNFSNSLYGPGSAWAPAAAPINDPILAGLFRRLRATRVPKVLLSAHANETFWRRAGTGTWSTWQKWRKLPTLPATVRGSYLMMRERTCHRENLFDKCSENVPRQETRFHLERCSQRPSVCIANLVEMTKSLSLSYLNAIFFFLN